MLSLFKKIRKKLLTNNKITAYLLYALGEIVLVVVGILIALQVNDWQEQKTNRLAEITVLENIQHDLQSDTADLIFNLRYHRIFLENEKKLLSYLQRPKQIDINQISFENALGSPLFSVLHEASFFNLQNNNLGIISNNKLKQEISRHYDFFVRTIRALENEKIAYETYPTKLPYFLKHFVLDSSYTVLSNEDLLSRNFYNPDLERSGLRIDNSEALIKDEPFKIILAESILVRQVKIGFYQDFLTRTKELNKLIDRELENLTYQ